MKLLKGIIISSVMIVILLVFSFESLAVPNLQIYIPGATYDPVTEDWVITSRDFDLWIIGANYSLEDVKFAAAVPTNQDGSIEVTWLNDGEVFYDWNDDDGDGVMDFYSDSYAVTNDTLTFLESDADPLHHYNYPSYLEYLSESADPPSTIPDPDPFVYGFGEYDNNDYPLYSQNDTTNIPGGGIFPTDFYEYYVGGFGLDELVYNYDPAEGFNPVTGTGDDSTTGLIKKFNIKVNGYMMTNFVAYGYYYANNNRLRTTINPYSHGGSMVVPEPATLFLLGTGMIGMGAFGRRKFFKKL